MSKKIQKLTTAESMLSLALMLQGGFGWFVGLFGGLTAITAGLAMKAPFITANAPLSYWLLSCVVFILALSGFLLISALINRKKTESIKTEMLLEFDGKNFKEVNKENIFSFMDIVSSMGGIKSADPEMNRVLHEVFSDPKTLVSTMHNLVFLFEDFIASPIPVIKTELRDSANNMQLNRGHYDKRCALFTIINPVKGLYRLEVENG